MLFAGNGLASVCGVPHGQTKGVGQTDQGQEFTQRVVAGQVAVFQVKPPAFQILEALLDGPALGVELAQLLQARGAKEKKKLAAGQRLDPHLPLHPIHLALGKAPVLPLGQPQVGNSVAVAVRVGQ